MKIVLYLMNEKGKMTLEKICEYFGAKTIVAVISSRDQNVKNDYYDEIQNICFNQKIAFFDRHENISINDEIFCLAVGWRWIITPSEKLIIFHDSLLPKYRGFAPLVNSLINGESEIGVSALFASNEYDRGNIIAQKCLPITYPIRIEEAILKIAPLYQTLAIEVVEAIQKGSLYGVPQNEIDATYSIWRDADDYHINWNEDAATIVRFINAVGFPYTGAFSLMNDEKVYILEAIEMADIQLELQHPGKVIFTEGDFPVVIAGQGLVKILKMIDGNGHNLLPLKYFRIRFK